jgi:hypothetical protein
MGVILKILTLLSINQLLVLALATAEIVVEKTKTKKDDVVLEEIKKIIERYRQRLKEFENP